MFSSHYRAKTLRGTETPAQQRLGFASPHTGHYRAKTLRGTETPQKFKADLFPRWVTIGQKPFGVLKLWQTFRTLPQKSFHPRSHYRAKTLRGTETLRCHRKRSWQTGEHGHYRAKTLRGTETKW